MEINWQIKSMVKWSEGGDANLVSLVVASARRKKVWIGIWRLRFGGCSRDSSSNAEGITRFYEDLLIGSILLIIRINAWNDLLRRLAGLFGVWIKMLVVHKSRWFHYGLLLVIKTVWRVILWRFSLTSFLMFRLVIW